MRTARCYGGNALRDGGAISRKRKQDGDSTPAACGLGRSVELAEHRQVAGRAVAEDHVRHAVALRAHVPHAIPEEAQIGLAVAIPVEEQRNILRQAAEDDVMSAVPLRFVSMYQIPLR